jgi:hypothetical protein
MTQPDRLRIVQGIGYLFAGIALEAQRLIVLLDDSLK